MADPDDYENGKQIVLISMQQADLTALPVPIISSSSNSITSISTIITHHMHVFQINSDEYHKQETVTTITINISTLKY